MNTVEPLLADHPTRPLIAWMLTLFAANAHPAYDAVRSRLTQFVPNHEPMTLAAVSNLLPGRWALFDVPQVLQLVIEHAGLIDADPAFPWLLIGRAGLSIDITPEQLPWELREEARFFDEIYKPVPWTSELAPIPGHYAHMSAERPGLIAYTQDAAKGTADKQTQIKPGRYLKRFYPALSEADVRRLAASVPRPATLAFARTADEIESVYLEGPHSCMAHPADHFDGPCHPVRVYGDSDLALAYATPSGEKPTARALVWPERKRFGRIYGDDALLEPLLNEAGYTRGSFMGARIRRIPVEVGDDVKVVMPYIDDTASFDEIDNTWLRVGGPYQAGSTNGVAVTKVTRFTCASCDEECSELFDVGNERWCDSCQNSDAFHSDFSGDWFPAVDAQEVVVRRRNGNNIVETWAECELEDEATYCEGSGSYYKDSTFEFVTLKNGETWEASYFAAHGDPEEAPAPDVPVAAENDNQATEERAAA